MARTELGGIARLCACVAAAASLAACASVQPEAPQPVTAYAPQKVGRPYQVGGIWYVPRQQPDYDVIGVASWYGDQFHLRPTADGEIFDMNAVSGAHTTLPLPCIVEVTNLDNGRKLRVRVNDRGPFVGGRLIDLSHEAARQLGYDRAGLAHVRVRYVGPAPLLGPEAGVREAAARPAPRSTAPVEPAVASVRWKDPSQAAGPPVVLTAAAAPVAAAASPGAAIGVQSLPPPSAPSALSAPSAPGAPIWPYASRSASRASAEPQAAAGFRIQAGAFSEEAKARRAAAQLNALGVAVVEPIQRGSVTLYRVMLAAPADELQAYNLRQRVAEVGFADARVVRVF